MRFLIVLSLSISSISHARESEVLNEFQQHRRLSFMLRGRGPTLTEVALLRNAKPQERPGVLAKMTEAMVNSSKFDEVMAEFIADTFRVKPATLKVSVGTEFTSLHLRFLELVRKNRPWDELLTSQTVFSTFPDLKDRRGEARFYKAVLSPEQILVLKKFKEEQLGTVLGESNQEYSAPLNREAISRQLEASTPFMAGVLTDPTFLHRFPTTPVNQNRKRAAAVFRLFLCDEMRAVILPDANAQRELELAALDDGASARAAVQDNPDIIKLHANDEKCSSCHYKLDPLAAVFKGNGTRLTNRPVPGALKFKRKSGDLVNIPFNNASELAQALIKQPEYVSCQVRHFWKMFVGADVPMSAKVEKELVEKFNSVGRRTKDFARYILTRPEVSRFPIFTIDNIDHQQVSGILKNCQSCHDNNFEAPDVVTLPLGTPRTIVHVLDLLGNGSAASMPPKSAGWKLEGGDRAMMTAWLAGGAKRTNEEEGAAGEETWNNMELREKLRAKLEAERTNFALRPSFDYTAKRRVTVSMLDQTLLGLANELVPKEEYKPYADDVVTRNLETGDVLAVPPASYGNTLNSKLISFRYFIEKTATARLKKLGLKIPKSECHTKKQGWERDYCEIQFAKDVHNNVELLRSMFEVIYGYNAMNNEYIALARFAALSAETHAGTLADRVPGYFTQMLMTGRYLTY